MHILQVIQLQQFKNMPLLLVNFLKTPFNILKRSVPGGSCIKKPLRMSIISRTLLKDTAIATRPSCAE